MVKRYCTALLLSVFCTVVAGEEMTDFDHVAGLYNSSDRKVRVTAYILTAQTNSDIVRSYMKTLAKEKIGVELTAILYALQTSSGSFEDEEHFINSVHTDEQYIGDLLAVDSGESSYLRGAPYLYIISRIAVIALRNDLALDKLRAIYKYADGWIAENIAVMIKDAESYRKKRTNK